jgi:tetratricopeptide (TPR) repeat protein
LYLRGLAYLKAGRNPEATTEFQKFQDHRGLVVNFPLGALAHLQLARAYTAAGDNIKAKAASQDFFNIWKDADPDIPIFKEAKAEYAKLQ